MGTYHPTTREAIGDIAFGMCVQRAAADLPAGTSDDLFTISGGLVRLYIVGEVTTVIETQLNNTNLEFLPSAATGARNDLCAALDITGDVVGTLYTITGTAGDPMNDSGTAGWDIQRDPIIIAPGTIELHCSATNTGQVKWTVWYVPVEPAAYVTTA